MCADRTSPTDAIMDNGATVVLVGDTAVLVAVVEDYGRAMVRLGRDTMTPREARAFAATLLAAAARADSIERPADAR